MSDEKDKNFIDYVPFRSFPSRLYAQMVKEALAQQEIPSIIKSDDIGIMLGSYSTVSPVEVTLWVRKSDLEECGKIADFMLNHI